MDSSRCNQSCFLGGGNTEWRQLCEKVVRSLGGCVKADKWPVDSWVRAGQGIKMIGGGGVGLCRFMTQLHCEGTRSHREGVIEIQKRHYPLTIYVPVHKCCRFAMCSKFYCYFMKFFWAIVSVFSLNWKVIYSPFNCMIAIVCFYVCNAWRLRTFKVCVR